MLIPDITLGQQWRAVQASQWFVNMVIMKVSETAEEYIPSEVMTALMTNELKIEMQAKWEHNEFIAGLDTAAINVGLQHELATKSGYRWYPAGPYSTQVYGGTQPIQLRLEFIAYNDDTIAPLNYASNIQLTNASTMTTLLSELMLPRKVIGRNEWYTSGVYKEHMGLMAAQTLTAVGVQVGQKLTAAASRSAAMRGGVAGAVGSVAFSTLSELLPAAGAILGDQYAGDRILRDVLKQTGNDFLVVNINKYIVGCFVCENLSQEVSKERILLTNNSSAPRWVKYTLQLKTLQIPSKDEQRKYRGEDNEFKSSYDIKGMRNLLFRFGTETIKDKK